MEKHCNRIEADVCIRTTIKELINIIPNSIFIDGESIYRVNYASILNNGNKILLQMILYALMKNYKHRI